MYDATLTSEDDALDETCVAVVTTGTESALDRYGLGGIETDSSTPTTLLCMNIPQTILIDRESGMNTTSPVQLLIKDPTSVVSENTRIRFRNVEYAIDHLVTPDKDDTLVHVTLKFVKDIT